MSDTVTIPADKARLMAETFRLIASTPDDLAWEFADLLDPKPKPPTLREQVAEAMQDTFKPNPGATLAVDLADAALAVVRDAMLALPHPDGCTR